MRRVAGVILVLALGAVSFGYDSGDGSSRWPPAPAESIAQAERKFAEGIEALESDREAGERLLRESAMRYTIAGGGLSNGYAWYNAGNAWLLGGETGRAIAAFRRAQRVLPNDERVAANLAEARSRVVDRVEASGGRQVARTVFFWHYDVPARWRALGVVGAWGLVWIGGAWCLVRGWGAAKGWMIGVGVVGVAALGTSLGVGERERSVQREAVIVAESVVARTGPDETAYGARFERPLHDGVEVWIEEERAGWVYVRLADGREAWVPSVAVERI